MSVMRSSPTFRSIGQPQKTSVPIRRTSPLATKMSASQSPKESMNLSADEISESPHQLKRVLRWPDLMMLGIGCTIGSGLFVVTGEVAANISGPAVCLSYVIAGFACLCASFCYAEFASMYTGTSGSAYHYAKSTMGVPMGWLIGWDLLSEYVVSGAAVAKGWSKHVAHFMGELGVPLLPTKLMNAPFNESGELTDNVIDLPAVFITVLLTCFLLRGMHSSTWLNTVMVVVKLSVVLFVLVIGFPLINWSNFTPFMPYGFSSLTLFGHTIVGSTVNGESVGVVAGASIVFFSYVGFDSVSTCARECVNPARDVPIGLIGSLVVSTVLYVSVSMVLIGIVPYQLIDVGAPFSAAFSSIGLPWASMVLSVGACTGITSVLLVTMLGAPRLCMAMAQDRLLPRAFADVNAAGTPATGSTITCALICLMAGLLPMSILVEMVSIGTLFAFVMVCVCVLVYRYTHPHVPRPFRCPASPVIPITGVAMCTYLMLALPLTNWIRLFVWLAIGAFIYVVYGRRRYQDREQYQATKQEESISHRVDGSIDHMSESDDDECEIEVNDLIDQWSDEDVNAQYVSNPSNDDDDALSVSRMKSEQ